MTTFFTMLGASFSLVFLMMVGLWVVYLFQRIAGIVDIGWGIGFILSAWVYFYLGDGNFWKMLTITLMVTIWAVRLTGHLYLRFRNSEREEPRYSVLYKQWGANALLLFLAMFIFQGVLIIILSLPFLLVSTWSHSSWSAWEAWGMAIWLIGVVGETLADAQLKAFLNNSCNKGKVCKVGLWRFSRHPNYFFEVLVWAGFALFAYPCDWGILAFISPAIMLVLLLKVSGVPVTEAQALITKGDLYSEYQKSTSLLIPWFPKE